MAFFYSACRMNDRILEALILPMTSVELGKKLGVAPKVLGGYLRGLANKGQVRQVGKRHGRHVEWERTYNFGFDITPLLEAWPVPMPSVSGPVRVHTVDWHTEQERV